MKIKFIWDTIISTEEAEYDIEEMSKGSLVNIIKIFFRQIPEANNMKNLCFNLQDYFVFQAKIGKRISSVGVEKEDLEEVLNIIVNTNNYVMPSEENKWLN